MHKLWVILISCFLVSSVYGSNGNIDETATFSVSDDSVTVYNPHELSFSPDGGVADDGDGSATVNLDDALNGTFLRIDGGNSPTADIEWDNNNINDVNKITFDTDDNTYFTKDSDMVKLFVDGVLQAQWPIAEAAVGDVILLESVDFALLETGDKILLEV